MEARAVVKRHGANVVLRDLTFALPRGAMATLVGRSGSGKSTIFKLLAGLDRPNAGEIRIDGESIAAMGEEQLAQMRLRRIGLVFQSANLLPDLSVLENLRLPLDLAGVRRADANARALELLALLGMEDAAEKRPHMLSGGEAQRVAIVRAIANEPSLLLADEPTGALDADNANRVMDLFEEINRRLGTTVLIVTHDQLVIDRVPARLAIRDAAVVWERPHAYVAQPL